MENDAELQRALVQMRRHLRRARIAAGVTLAVIVIHLEWLTLPCAASSGPIAAVFVAAYPLVLAAMVMAPLFQRRS